VFDANTDTYDALHDRSPFAVNCICMVAARVRDGGGKILRHYGSFGHVLIYLIRDRKSQRDLQEGP
jgi:hypothetical protein